jgi:hypothetical protein
MMTPSAASQSSFLEEAAGPTLLSCHAFPQERRMDRGGTPSQRKSGSLAATVPSSCRKPSRFPCLRVAAGAARFYQRVSALSISHIDGLVPCTPTRNRARISLASGCYTRSLVCRASHHLGVTTARRARFRGSSKPSCRNEQLCRFIRRLRRQDCPATASSFISGRSAVR